MVTYLLRQFVETITGIFKDYASYARHYEHVKKERAGGGFNSSIYKWQRIYSEALDAGFQTSNRYAVLNTGEDRTYITNLLDQFKDNNTKQAFRYVINMTYDFASMIENGVRLASYQQMREAGYTPQQSASVAKNLTINFDKKGY